MRKKIEEGKLNKSPKLYVFKKLFDLVVLIIGALFLMILMLCFLDMENTANNLPQVIEYYIASDFPFEFVGGGILIATTIRAMISFLELFWWK